MPIFHTIHLNSSIADYIGKYGSYFDIPPAYIDATTQPVSVQSIGLGDHVGIIRPTSTHLSQPGYLFSTYVKNKIYNIPLENLGHSFLDSGKRYFSFFSKNPSMLPLEALDIRNVPIFKYNAQGFDISQRGQIHIISPFNHTIKTPLAIPIGYDSRDATISYFSIGDQVFPSLKHAEVASSVDIQGDRLGNPLYDFTEKVRLWGESANVNNVHIHAPSRSIQIEHNSVSFIEGRRGNFIEERRENKYFRFMAKYQSEYNSLFSTGFDYKEDPSLFSRKGLYLFLHNNQPLTEVQNEYIKTQGFPRTYKIARAPSYEDDNLVPPYQNAPTAAPTGAPTLDQP